MLFFVRLLVHSVVRSVIGLIVVVFRSVIRSVGWSFRSVGPFVRSVLSAQSVVLSVIRSVSLFVRSFRLVGPLLSRSVGRSFRSVGPFRSGGHSVLRSVIGSDGI